MKNHIAKAEGQHQVEEDHSEIMQNKGRKDPENKIEQQEDFKQ